VSICGYFTAEHQHTVHPPPSRERTCPRHCSTGGRPDLRVHRTSADIQGMDQRAAILRTVCAQLLANSTNRRPPCPMAGMCALWRQQDSYWSVCMQVGFAKDRDRTLTERTCCQQPCSHTLGPERHTRQTLPPPLPALCPEISELCRSQPALLPTRM